MDLSQDDVLQILKLLEVSNVDYLEVQVGDMRLVASKSGVLPAGAAAPTASAAAPDAPPPPASDQVPPPATAPSTGDAAPTQPAGVDTTVATTAAPGGEGLVPITAPVVGVFYIAPEPGAPPFVEVGSRVHAETTVGLVEVMKVFNSVTAGVTGEVVRVLAANDEFVEYGQPLFLVRPE